MVNFIFLKLKVYFTLNFVGCGLILLELCICLCIDYCLFAAAWQSGGPLGHFNCVMSNVTQIWVLVLNYTISCKLLNIVAPTELIILLKVKLRV